MFLSIVGNLGITGHLVVFYIWLFFFAFWSFFFIYFFFLFFSFRFLECVLSPLLFFLKLLVFLWVDVEGAVAGRWCLGKGSRWNEVDGSRGFDSVHGVVDREVS